MNTLQNDIRQLAKQKNAVILAHNYQLPEVQDIADVLGDSLYLSEQAAATNADIILFCGVHFMAETAKMLSPGKKVLLPDLGAGCSLASMINADELRGWKKEHPGAAVISYVNTTAEVKAESDYCCTSANAVPIVNSIPRERDILFLPDLFLGHYVKEMTGRKNFYIWPGECHVHKKLRIEAVFDKMAEHPNAELLIHPECGCTTDLFMRLISVKIKKGVKIKFFGTGGMLRYVKESLVRQFVVGTETGLIYRLQKENPEKEFVPLDPCAVCHFMKKITLEKVRDALLYEQYEITVPLDIAEKAKQAIDRMISIQ